jgi:hypothetical protein
VLPDAFQSQKLVIKIADSISPGPNEGDTKMQLIDCKNQELNNFVTLFLLRKFEYFEIMPAGKHDSK